MKLHKLLIAAAALIGIASCNDHETYEPKPWGSDLMVKEKVALAATDAQILNIKATATPSLATDAAWLHIGELKSTVAGMYAVELKGDLNPEGVERTAVINVTAGAAKATVSVTQYVGEALIIDSVDPSTVLDPKGGTLTVKYTATAEPQVQVPDWMTIVGSKALVEGVLTLNYDAALSAAREGEIVLTLGKLTETIAVSQEKAEASGDMKSNAKELAAKMYAGINIGNTLECPNGEADWINGKVKVNTTYIAGLKALGFNAVRVPCAWNTHLSDASTNTIDPEWLARVDEVVGYIVSNDMYAIVNIHWDGGWLEESCKNGYDEAVNTKQRDFWTQIATQLNHYDEHLLFAAMNEPNHNGNASTDAIMAYQKTMIDAVRATGGNNATRVLVMQVPSTNIDEGCKGYYKMPADVVEDRLMAEAHFYDPYQFNMMEEDANWGKVHWYWGAENHVAGSDRNSESRYEEDYVKQQMQKLKTTFVDNGYPVILGEYAVCVDRSGAAGIDVAKHQASHTLWNRVVTREAKNAGVVPFFWETGGDVNRRDGSVIRSYQIDGVIAGAAEGTYPF